MNDLLFSESLEMDPDLLEEHGPGDQGNARTLHEVIEADEVSIRVSHLHFFLFLYYFRQG